MIQEVTDFEMKERIATEILCDLSSWFGLADETTKYIEESKKHPFMAYFVENQPIAFVVLRATSKECAELLVMGVLKAYHHAGIGKQLYAYVEAYAKTKHFSYLQVKTVPMGHYHEYDMTNLFYQSVGFCELECFPTLWDEHPCQIYIKYIG